MQKCSNCGFDLPANSRFCGRCGSVQEAIDTGAATTRSTNPQSQSWMPESATIATTWPPFNNTPFPGSEPGWPPNNTPFPFSEPPGWPPNAQALGTRMPPPPAENEDEHRRGVPPWPPVYGAVLGGDALLGNWQAHTPGAPVVQGTPQIGSVPGVAGSPIPYTNAPASFFRQGAGNAPPGSFPMQGAGNVPVNYPVQGTNYPFQGAGHAPMSYPVQKPQPTPYPPQHPGTPEPHPPHKPHRHHTNPRKHEPDGHDTHHVHRKFRREGASKVAGGLTIKTTMIVLAAVVVVAASGIGAAAYFLSRPQPLISITSNYKVGNTPAGANGTVLHVNGQKFSSNSAITLLLDGHVAQGIQGIESDSNGNFSANVSITGAWSVGIHTLSARDASNYSPKNSASVTIVQQGRANTPGPNGAPPDDASFKIIAKIQVQGAAGVNPYSTQETEFVTGHSDPEGGTVCRSEDNGKTVVTSTYTYNTHIPVRKTSTFSCSGSYKGGKLTFTETMRTETSVYSQFNGTTATCTLNSPQPDEQMSGSYIGKNTFKGTLTYPAIPSKDFTCHSSDGFYKWYLYEQGNWTGQVTDLHSL